MKKSPKIPKLHYIYNVFLLILPPILFFSYRPLISLGSDQTMNFEFSLPLLWLILFDLLSLIILFQTKLTLRFSKIWPWLLFPAFLTVSVAWSLNPLRGLLTVGILWLIYFAVFSFFILRRKVHFFHNFTTIFWRVFFISSLLICAWCWLQCILDLNNLPQATTLMCDGCIYQMFGFPHPDGFAIEPQFMGNLLLAPTLLSAWFAFGRSSRPRQKTVTIKASAKTSTKTTTKNPMPIIASPFKSRPLCYLIFFVLAATLFLTFSRGAIYAFLAAMLLLTLWRAFQIKSALPLTHWLIVILAFLFTLNAQGIMTVLGPTHDTYRVGVSKAIHQLSLGLIDFRPAELTTSNSSSIEDNFTNPSSISKSTEDISNNPTTQPSDNASSSDATAFAGYIPESTNTRLRLTDSALQIWRSTPSTVIFGVGLGGAGQALYDADLSPAPKEIVQNEYASLLLETGLLGCLLAIFTLYLVYRYLSDSPLRLPLFSLLLAYAVTLCFFSGLPNALQIYLLPPLLLFVSKL